MSLIKPGYPKNQVNKAGKNLIKPNISKEERNSALMILNNWRSSHDYPMNTFQANIRGKIKKLRFTALVFERLKRTPSIIRKLARYKSMALTTMQDIGGLRVVLREISNVIKLKETLLDMRWDHDFVGIDDYITTPKASGYRSLHLKYKYKNKYNPDYDGLQIEIQLRTKLQHIWATAVETMGIVLSHSLKSSEGPTERLDFFAIVSSMFARKEECNIIPGHIDMTEEQIKDQLKEMAKKLQVIERMQAYSRAIKLIDEHSKKKKGYEYYLLVLDSIEKTISVISFRKGELEKATQMYLEKEKLFIDETKGQVVLVSLDGLRSIKDLKACYPNYFGDTTEFVRILSNLIK